MTVASRDEFGGRRTIRLNWHDTPPAWARQGVVSVGNFDGVHRGHAALVQQARELGTTVGARVVLATFDPHPLQLLAPERFQPLLTSPEDRAELLVAAGADGVVILQTDAELLNLSADAFFDQLLVERFGAKGIVEGFNFRFGHNRLGSVDALRDKCQAAGVAFRLVESFKMDEIVVSSSRVRSALMSGDVALAATLLNRPYRVRGEVVIGAQRGRTIGFPTANLDRVATLLPADGVYAVRVEAAGQVWPGAANIGPNPTFGDNARKIEVHLLGFAADLYGQSIAVDFVERLRATKKFSNVAELIEQMKSDIERTRQLLS